VDESAKKDKNMKTYIIKDEKSPTNYSLMNIKDDGTEEVVKIEKTYKGEPNTLVLPTNESNRKYFNSKKVDTSNGKIELTYKASISIGTTSRTIRPITDFMDEDEKVTYEAILAKAKKRREDESKPANLTAIEKAERQYNRAKASYEALAAADKTEAKPDDKTEAKPAAKKSKGGK